MNSPEPRRRRFALITVLAGAIGSAVLALTLTGTLSAFTASITNSTNTTNQGTLVLTETGPDGTTTCVSSGGTLNAVTCGTINKYGGATLVPTATTPASSTTTVTMANTGTVAGSTFTLQGGTCSQTGTPLFGAPAASLCTKMNVAVYVGTGTGGTKLYDGLMSAFPASISLTGLAPAASQAYTFVVTAPTSLDNTYQGLGVSQPLVWTLSA